MGLTLGGGVFVTNANVSVRNSIIANSANGFDVWGAVIDLGYNICSDGTAGFSALGSLNQVDPMLSALSQNGGPTPTMALLAGSPARDAIPSGFPATDQRGIIRPQGPAADIGAVEADFISSSPTISIQPIGGTVRAGTNFTLSVGASGTAPLFYQWYKDTNLISGATSSQLALSNVQAAAAGTYFVVVSNTFGTMPSQNAVLVVDSTPLLLSQPASVVVPPGGNAYFDVSADGPSLTYQWWHDEVAVPGATGASLAVSNATAGAQGSYFVVVSNFAGSATSQIATLSFDSSALSILVQPQDTSARVGYPASFSVVASGVPSLSYQWQHDGKPITGATNSSYPLAAVATNDAGGYAVVITNGYRAVTSTLANLVVTPGPAAPKLAVTTLGANLVITFQAEAGQSYLLLSSTNLVSWSAVATNSAVLSGTLQFIQPFKTSGAALYRVSTR